MYKLINFHLFKLSENFVDKQNLKKYFLLRKDNILVVIFRTVDLLHWGKLMHNVSAAQSSGFSQVSLVYLGIEMIQPGELFWLLIKRGVQELWKSYLFIYLN